MKRKYERPMAFEETFMTNEYVAACWGVACSIDSANKVDKGHYGVDHVAKHCGLDTNQHIYTNSKGVAVSMIEEGTDGLGNLTCNLYTDSSYRYSKSYSSVKQGDYIYWTTKSGNRTWHHQGFVKSTYKNRPNHS
ncbi:hypothetical protein KQI13_01920 [Anaerostipes hadrus]|jgi:hypothetical protein|nr:hypothetical protein [Anaerostipes hadrus]